jgi:hypothetical protein
VGKALRDEEYEVLSSFWVRASGSHTARGAVVCRRLRAAFEASFDAALRLLHEPTSNVVGSCANLTRQSLDWV